MKQSQKVKIKFLQGTAPVIRWNIDFRSGLYFKYYLYSVYILESFFMTPSHSYRTIILFKGISLNEIENTVRLICKYNLLSLIKFGTTDYGREFRVTVD